VGKQYAYALQLWIGDNFIWNRADAGGVSRISTYLDFPDPLTSDPRWEFDFQLQLQTLTSPSVGWKCSSTRNVCQSSTLACQKYYAGKQFNILDSSLVCTVGQHSVFVKVHSVHNFLARHFRYVCIYIHVEVHGCVMRSHCYIAHATPGVKYLCSALRVAHWCGVLGRRKQRSWLQAFRLAFCVCQNSPPVTNARWRKLHCLLRC